MTKKIIINAKEYETDLNSISYNQLLEMCKKSYGCSAVYRSKIFIIDGEEMQRSGTLYDGKTIKLEDGMNFNVMMTGNA